MVGVGVAGHRPHRLGGLWPGEGIQVAERQHDAVMFEASCGRCVDDHPGGGAAQRGSHLRAMGAYLREQRRMMRDRMTRALRFGQDAMLQQVVEVV